MTFGNVFAPKRLKGKSVKEANRSKLRVVLLVLFTIFPSSFIASQNGIGSNSMRTCCRAADVSSIVRQSVAANTADWKAQPLYSHVERETKNKFDSDGQVKSSQAKTFQVTMIKGSPYYRLLELDNEPLTPARKQQEQDKLNREIYRRQNESSEQRQARLAKYQNDRSEEHLLMQQMVDAFTFKLSREEHVEGVDCYLLDAVPNADYRPPVEKARVLLGMKGHLWVDKAGYHWVKVEAEVTKPVQFGFFIAQVKSGTRFELEQAPVGGVWLPKRFVENVNASIFGIYGMRSRQEEIYSDYRLLSQQSDAHPPSGTVTAAKAALNGSSRGDSPAH